MMLQINLSNQLRALRFLLIITLINFIIYFYYNFDSYVVIGFSIFWSFFGIPALYLHIEYIFFNYGVRIEIIGDELIWQKRNGGVKKYTSDDFEKIVFYNTRVLEPNFWQVAPMSSYYYARIFVKSGSAIIITCLMSKGFNDQLKEIRNVQYRNKYTLFASILFPITV